MGDCDRGASRDLIGGTDMPYQLSVRRILKRDWPCFGLVIFIGCGWLVGIGDYVLMAMWFREDRDGWALAHILGVGVLFATVLCAVVIVWRMQVIRRVFGSGEVVQGHVLSVGENSEDIGYALIAYQYQGRDYCTRNVTEGASERGGLTPGELVELVVDPAKPSRAFVAKLYIE